MELAARLSFLIVRIQREKQTCCQHDLEAFGFSAEQIENSWDLATALACVAGMEDEPVCSVQ